MDRFDQPNNSHPDVQKVLLIDDSQEDAHLMERALSKQPFPTDFQWVADPIEGLEILTSWRGQEDDLIFLDIKMPKMSGLEILEELENRGKLCNLQRINVLSSSVLRRDVEAATHYSNVQYFTKPQGYLALREFLSTITTTPSDGPSQHS